jgi:arylsulfatase A-like enzyme
MRRKWGTCCACLGIGIALFGAVIASRPAARTKPTWNVILVTLDTTRADHLGCYGSETALTPTLDELARRGIVFERAYTSAPFTLPAHASIHTGLYPFEHGLFNNGMSRLNDSFPTLAETLTRGGYATGAFVGSYVLNGQFGLNRGFATYNDLMAPNGQDSHGLPQRSADQVVDAALPWLAEHATHPFFCWVHFYDPHFDYVDHSAALGDRFRDHPYDGEIAFVDRQLQRVVEFVEAQHLAEKTLIIVVGDHGEGLGDHLERWHGNMLYNSTLQVPLIVSMPTHSSSGLRVATPISLIDVGATLLDCLEVSPPAGFGGQSFRPALMGKSIPPGECYGASDGVYVEEGWSPLRCLVTEDWKYIQTTRPELYDMRNDPGETTNLIASRPEVAEQMNQRLTHMESQGVRHETQVLELSSREQKVMASLGYLGSRTSRHNTEREEDLADIKDSAAAVYEFQIIQELYWRRQKNVAVARLQELVEAAPHYMAPRLMVGRVLEAEEKFAEAKRYFDGVLQADPENKEANARIGKILAREGRYDQSLPYLHKALDRDAKGNRSVAAAEALPFLVKALEAEPNSVDLRYVVAKMLRTQGRNAEAMEHMRAAEMILKQQQGERRTEP